MRYPLRLTPDEGGAFMAEFPDFGYGITFGSGRAEAIEQASDLLVEIIAGAIAHDEEIPCPSDAGDGPSVAVPATLAAKVELYQAWRAERIPKAELARRMGITRQQAQRLFDPTYNSRISQLEQAMAALGWRLVVTAEKVA